MIEKLIRRLLWKREVFELEGKVSELTQKLEISENERLVYFECYESNLKELETRDHLIRDLRFRLSAIGKAERTRKVALP